MPVLTPPKGIFTGYVWNPSIAPLDKISAPSHDVMVNENGEVEQRLGYLDTAIDLGFEGDPVNSSLYIERYDVTAFVVDNSAIALYDWTTGETFTPSSNLSGVATTRLAEYAGDLYSTNTTDGLCRIVIGRVNDSAANLGDPNITVDADMAARLSRFGITSGDLEWNGNAIGFNAVNVSTGLITLTGTLSDNIPNNALITYYHDISSGREKFSKVFFWKERMGGFGSISTTNADQPNATEYFGKFAGPDTLENIIDFTYGSGGATTELVGKSGSVTNALPAKDYLYTFKETETYICGAGDVIISGASIGSTPPDLRDENNGCINEDCAAVTGNSEVTYVSPTKRAMMFRIATSSGAPVAYPDEKFDRDIRGHLQDMNNDQTGALVTHWKGQRITIYQLKIGSQWTWFIYDHKINAWQPPQNLPQASSFFERKGILYFTVPDDDTIYSLFTSFSDNGNEIDSELWTGDINVGNSTMLECHAQGIITQSADIRLQTHVTNQRGGKQSGSEKHVLGSDFTYSADFSVGALPVGDAPGSSETSQYATWDKTFDIFPSEANRVQFSLKQSEDGGYYRLSTYSITYQPSSHFQKSA